MSEIALDHLRSEDREPVLEWFQLFLDEHLGWWCEAFGTNPKLRAGHGDKQWKLLIDAAESERELVKVARLDSVVVGIVWATIKQEDWFDCEVGLLNWIAVAPSAQKKGVGSQLLDATEQWFSSHQVAGKMLNVSSHNTIAIKTYQKFGYRIVDHRMCGSF